jgi:ubiquinone/menaquinone biosynthesis C-methylase UbiE
MSLFFFWKSKSISNRVIKDFGDEWNIYDQSRLTDEEAILQFKSYFKNFPFNFISSNSIGFDAGCGSGRWAKIIAPQVKTLYCIDPSSSIYIAKKNLKSFSNCIFFKSTIKNMPLKDKSMDFGYCLGVLHHLENTEDSLNKCVSKLKKGAPFLLYIYYSFDNQPQWYKFIWKASEIIRGIVSKLPFNIKYFISVLIAIFIYFPLSRLSNLIKYFGFSIHSFPLSAYRNRSFYSMCTDSLDRFGTRYEKRFSKAEIREMMLNSGLINIKFNNSAPYHCAIGFKS